MSGMGESGERTAESLRREIAALVEGYAALVYAPQPFVPGASMVPVSGKVLGAAELQGMVAASLDGWLTTGRFNEQFEEQLARFLGVKYLLTVNSGSSANLLAFASLTSPRLGKRAIRAGDEVITVAACFPTTVSPIVQYGAVPVFVDIDPLTCNVDVGQLEAALSPRSKAVMLAHTLGNPFALDEVVAFCRRHGLWLVEDCCDALGSSFRGRPVGSFGDIATLSFYPAHHITMGEGGAVFTNNPELRVIATSMRDWGRDCYCPPGRDNTCNKRFQKQWGELPAGYDHKYVYSHMGYNLKITDMQAACGLAQLQRLPEFIAARKANYRYLRERLLPFAAQMRVQEATAESDPAWFGLLLTLRDDWDRVPLLKELERQKIGTRLLFAGNILRQPCMAGQNYRVIGELEHTERVMKQALWLGLYPGLTEAHLSFMVERLSAYCAAAS
ncbi:lipopolysaccharide biosynthesis protein RfbH [Candidatus Magnetaquicoccus inordinatus]|uniref:lipopolysaccharide biosynthesis protein RfbH n=1 Tax=Candidatus Magnetaquicoccus inordinatus TaxID=2496818 RepID=UPI001D0E3303|nr:lipopolysaccharide biosynthesis protein RfbH [Candidatus Magnetaquicoccus inordinatus]